MDLFDRYAYETQSLMERLKKRALFEQRNSMFKLEEMLPLMLQSFDLNHQQMIDKIKTEHERLMEEGHFNSHVKIVENGKVLLDKDEKDLTEDDKALMNQYFNYDIKVDKNAIEQEIKEQEKQKIAFEKLDENLNKQAETKEKQNKQQLENKMFAPYIYAVVKEMDLQHNQDETVLEFYIDKLLQLYQHLREQEKQIFLEELNLVLKNEKEMLDIFGRGAIIEHIQKMFE